MSVTPGNQPATADHGALSPEAARELEAILAAYRGLEGPLLPILHAVQGAFGHIPQAAVPAIAGALNTTRAEIHGVITFYHDFRSEPVAGRVLRLCRGEACQAMGAETLAEHVRAGLGTDWHGTGKGVTLEPVFCLGLCACAPAAMLDGKLVARLDEAALDRLLEGSAA